MHSTHFETVVDLASTVLGTRRAQRALGLLELPDLPVDREGVHRAELTAALFVVLLDGIERRVTSAAAYLADVQLAGGRILLDHGALRTVAAPCGSLPPGRLAVARFLAPLGYEPTGVYPLDRLSMTGHVYTHRDLPEQLPQLFVSELHPERFDAPFQKAVQRVVRSSRDPLPGWTRETLGALALDGSLPFSSAVALLPELAACFDRHHDVPRWSDYELLLERSPEMAWIATEGHAFNHATDRVDDVVTLAEQQRVLGRPIKDEVEVSSSGRVLQTAFRATPVDRLFLGEQGEVLSRRVPGSFHEFISRRRLPDGKLDLAFDSSNAQGIFAMTQGGLR